MNVIFCGSFIFSLLHEAEPVNQKHAQETGNGQEDGEESRETTIVEERQLLSKYGIWLLVGLCTPNEHTPDASFFYVIFLYIKFIK